MMNLIRALEYLNSAYIGKYILTKLSERILLKRLKDSKTVRR